MHDERYKTIFAFPRMVEDLVRGFAAREWAGELDFSTLRKLPSEYVSDKRLTRRSDSVWQVRFRDGRHLLVALEFQSTDDPRMALRILVYTGLLYQELVRSEASSEASSRVSRMSGLCYAAWRHRDSERTPRSICRGCWPASRTRSAWPRWASGSCAATRETSFSPV